MKQYKKTLNHILLNRELILVLLLICISVFMSISSEFYFSFANFNSMFLGLTIEGVMVIGMVILLISGEMDLSVGSTMAFTGVMTGLSLNMGIPVMFSILIGVLSAMVIGGINGILISKLKLNSFITTLGMSIAVRGLMLIVANGKAVLNLPDTFNMLGRGKLLGIQYPIYLMILLVILFDFLVRNNRYFRQSYYVGGNEKTAQLNGIDVKKIKFVNYIIMAVIAGLVGILLTARFGSASVTVGNNTALNVITAAIIGGASLNGGKGTVVGAFLGATFLQVLSSSLNLLGVNIYWQSFVTGTILILAIVMDVLNNIKLNKA